MVCVDIAVEGITDEAVVRQIVEHLGATIGGVYGKAGKAALLQRVSGYNNAARFSPWFVLVDLDRDGECAPTLTAEWLPNPAPLMCFRVAVREVETWLLADRENISLFLGVPRTRVPVDPEALDDPKRTMVDLARHSRKMAIRDDMVPRPGSGRAAGRAYASRIIEFASRHWRPEVATGRCDSLRRTLACLQRLLANTDGGVDE